MSETNLRFLRESQGLTQRRLSELAGVCPRTVGIVETGEGPARMTTRRKLLEALGIPFVQWRVYFDEEGRAA